MTTAQSWRQPLIGTGGNPAGEIEALKASNRTAGSEVVFVTVLEAHPASDAPRIKPAIIQRGEEKILTLTAPERAWQFALRPGQRDRSSPALIQVAGR